MNFARRRRASADVNLTPLIDILFIVLLFLVLTATFSERTVLQIALPAAETGQQAGNAADGVRILVDADGLLYLDGRIRTLEEIRARLDAIPQKGTATVTVSADERARHGRIVQVMDEIRQAGIFRLDIETLAQATPLAPD